jgi:peptide chain release factor 1
MEDKLLGIEQRYEEIHKELAEVGQDYQRAADLGKERAELEPIVEAYRAYKTARDELKQAQDLVDADDAEMRQLAQEETTKLSEKIQLLEQQLKSMLLPKDPRDDMLKIIVGKLSCYPRMRLVWEVSAKSRSW